MGQLGNLLLISLIMAAVTCIERTEAQRRRVGNQLGAPKMSRGMTPRATPPPPSTKEIYATLEATQLLINQSDSQVALAENDRDFILLVGNTGAGRTTLASFLTGDDSVASDRLESYHAGDRFLIRDSKGRIGSGSSTLVSKSTLPILTKNENEIWADLAGFENSKSSSLELAQAFVNAKVAQHAHRVKIILVVNYSSLKSGESRVAFKNAVESLARFIKLADKFSPAISILATKVHAPSTMSNNQIIEGIAGFMKNLRSNLHEIIGNEELRENMVHILDALLTKGEDGLYKRIGLFPEPTEAGPLNQMANFKSVKSSLKKIIDENLEFVEPSEEDFGICLSSKARYFVLKAERNLEDEILEILTQIGIKLKEIFTKTSDETPLAESYNQLSILRNLTGDLENIDLSQGRVEYFNVLQGTLVNSLQFTDLSDKCNKLLELARHLDFLDTVVPIDPASSLAILPQMEWTEPLRLAVNSIGDLIYQKAAKINEAADSQANQLETELLKLYGAKILREESRPEQKPILAEDLSKDILTLSSFLNEAFLENTFNHFVNETTEAVTQLRVGVHQRIITNFANLGLPQDSDIDLVGGDPEKGSPFKVEEWLRHFESVVQYLKKEHGRLAYDLKEEEQQGIETSLQNNVTSVQEKHQATMDKINQELAGLQNAKVEAEEAALRNILLAQEQEIQAIEREEAERLARTTTTTTTTTTTEPPTTIPTTTADPFNTLYSPAKTNYGHWGDWEMCPSGTYVGGFQLKVQTRVNGDNTALNGVRLFCIRQRTNTIMKTLKSVEGAYGFWGSTWYCGSPVVGFQLRSEEPQGTGDDTAANNIKIFCENGITAIGGGMHWGDWTKERRCPNGELVCGLKTQVAQDDDDETGLNNLAVRCCSR